MANTRTFGNPYGKSVWGRGEHTGPFKQYSLKGLDYTVSTISTDNVVISKYGKTYMAAIIGGGPEAFKQFTSPNDLVRRMHMALAMEMPRQRFEQLFYSPEEIAAAQTAWHDHLAKQDVERLRRKAEEHAEFEQTWNIMTKGKSA